MRDSYRGKVRWIPITMVVGLALVLSGCAWGAPVTLAAFLLVLLVLGSCGAQSVPAGAQDADDWDHDDAQGDTGTEGDVAPDVSDSGADVGPDAPMASCGEGRCPDHMTCLALEDVGDWCMPDADEDGVWDGEDNCPWVANEAQADEDEDALGDACDLFPGPNLLSPCGENCYLDHDGDGVPLNDGSSRDNCPFLANPGQEDRDADWVGDVCDLYPDGPNPLTPCGDAWLDSDGDGWSDPSFCDEELDDNCPTTPSERRDDLDGDGLGDVCDPDGIAPIADLTREAARRALLRDLLNRGILDAETVSSALA